MVSFLLACGVVADRLHGSVVGNIVSQSQKYHRPLKKKEIMKVSCLSWLNTEHFNYATSDMEQLTYQFSIKL